MLDRMTKKLDIEERLIPHIGKVYKHLGILVKEQAKEHNADLSREQFILLKMLHNKDGVPQRELAFITENNKSSITRLINTMEKKNLVARIPSTGDGRVNHIFLTKKGRQVFTETLPLILDIFKEIEQGISEKEMQTAIYVLQKILKNIKNLSK